MLVSAAKQKNKKRQNISLPITVRRHHGLGPRRPLARAPLRYDVGDEVDVAVDGTVNVYPYDKGWKRGVILFKFCSVEEEHVRALLELMLKFILEADLHRTSEAVKYKIPTLYQSS